MKPKFINALIIMLATVVAAPVAIAEENGNDEPVVKRIFIRDGEVIEIDGNHAFEWNTEGGPLLGTQTFLGVHIVDISEDLRSYFRAPQDRGVLVSEVGDGTPAEKAGLKAGDVVIAIAGKPVTSASALRKLIGEHEAGTNVEIEVVRSGNRQKLYATLEKREGLHPKIRVHGEPREFRYRLDGNEPSLERLREFFDSPAWQSRVMKLDDCTEIQEKLEAMQKRLAEMEKKLQQLK